MSDIPIDRPTPAARARAAAVPVAPANRWIPAILLLLPRALVTVDDDELDDVAEG